jgi:hypothetical protein
VALCFSAIVPTSPATARRIEYTKVTDPLTGTSGRLYHGQPSRYVTPEWRQIRMRM